MDAERTRYQLTVVFQGGWRIVSASPEEQALLQAHGFASGGCREGIMAVCSAVRFKRALTGLLSLEQRDA